MTSPIYRLLSVLEQLTHYKQSMDRLYQETFYTHLTQTASLTSGLRRNQYGQSGLHVATACGMVVAAAFGTRKGIDVASCVSMVNKASDVGALLFRAHETGIQGSQRHVEHLLSRDAEASRRLTDFFHQFLGSIRSYNELLARV